MFYQDSVEESRQYLRMTLEMIGKYGLPTDPLNYRVCYEYVSGRNQALNHAIDEHVNNNDAFSHETIKEFYDQYIAIGTVKINQLIDGELKRVFQEIIGAIKATDRNFSASENNLDIINGSILPSLPPEAVEKIIEEIKKEIKNLAFSSSTFKEQLQQATSEIDKLKSTMMRYRDEALKDALTQIANRRGFDQKLEVAVQDARANNSQLCLIMADIDHFKRINDKHGHLVGDNVIRMVASTIKDSIKGKDVVARIGGEEFAILLPHTPQQGAVKLADDIRLSFEKLDLKKKSTGESLGKITLSFGVTLFQNDETTEAFLHRADKAMYQSKSNGRNRVSSL